MTTIRITRRTALAWLATTLGASATLAACGTGGPGSGTGVDADRIVIGVHGPKSGPAAAFTEGATAGFRLYVDDINARGGITGRKIEILEADDQYTVSGGAAAARQMADKVFLAYNIIGADPAIGALPEFERQGTPYLTIAAPLELAQDSDVAFIFPTPLELLAEAVPSFIQTELDPQGTRTVGVMWENQDLMREMRDRFTAVAKEAGLDIVVTESFDRDATSYVQNVKRVRDAGADLVVLLGGVAVPEVLKASETIGYDPMWTGAGAWTYDMINAASGGLMEGIRALRAGPAADAPDYEEFLARLHSTRDPSPTDELGYSGWAGAKFIEQLLRRLDGDLTQQRLLEELESGTSKANPIRLDSLPPIWYGPDRRYGSDAAVPSTVRNGHWVITGDPASRFE
ncbi:amino acid/amide ABC transporter substrate-binding protein (HAAT family) [Prauserella shujinwangii]|uniref:Amino acid/amide ABC transporter substrate-binding protein (HAAT family) n=1 Tax=Prauserella shujinwangii TaxID=1453103 RepID=A0A2T0M0K1_9PSEU|nr:ABC transporter substrate-binding protein [Prauserella shujinwangii]PRX50108.1 amino acid/amide ABC transporter substrate-binding protein (HAAT family) [Prauserella shujinwangii]